MGSSKESAQQSFASPTAPGGTSATEQSTAAKTLRQLPELLIACGQPTPGIPAQHHRACPGWPSCWLRTSIQQSWQLDGDQETSDAQGRARRQAYSAEKRIKAPSPNAATP